MSPEKKRLVFDLTEEEYNKFKKEAKKDRLSAIAYFREMWEFYREYSRAPGFRYEDKMPLDYTKTDWERARLLELIEASLRMLYLGNSRSHPYMIVSEQEWNLWISRLQDVLNIVKELPPPGTERITDTVPKMVEELSWFRGKGLIFSSEKHLNSKKHINSK